MEKKVIPEPTRVKNSTILTAWTKKFRAAREALKENGEKGVISWEQRLLARSADPTIVIEAWEDMVTVSNLHSKVFDAQGALIYNAIYKAWPEVASFTLHPESVPGRVEVSFNFTYDEL